MHADAISVSGGEHQHAQLVEQFEQQQPQLCDVELRVADSSLWAHRCVLAAVSGYFRAAFAGSGARMASDCGLHDLRDMGVSARHAITFLYRGSCTLASHDELVPLLHTAKRLDMPVLFDAVAATIGRHLTADSCVGAWTLGVDLDAPVLMAAARALCEKEFETLAHGDIGGLTHAAMAALLSSSNLVVEEEKAVFQALEVWWRAQRVPPTPEAVAELVHSVRFPHMDRDYIWQHVLPAPIMQLPAAKDALVAVMLAYLPPVRVCSVHGQTCSRDPCCSTECTFVASPPSLDQLWHTARPRNGGKTANVDEQKRVARKVRWPQRPAPAPAPAPFALPTRRWGRRRQAVHFTRKLPVWASWSILSILAVLALFVLSCIVAKVSSAAVTWDGTQVQQAAVQLPLCDIYKVSQRGSKGTLGAIDCLSPLVSYPGSQYDLSKARRAYFGELSDTSYSFIVYSIFRPASAHQELVMIRDKEQLNREATSGRWTYPGWRLAVAKRLAHDNANTYRDGLCDLHSAFPGSKGILGAIDCLSPLVSYPGSQYDLSRARRAYLEKYPDTSYSAWRFLYNIYDHASAYHELVMIRDKVHLDREAKSGRWTYPGWRLAVAKRLAHDNANTYYCVGLKYWASSIAGARPRAHINDACKDPDAAKSAMERAMQYRQDDNERPHANNTWSAFLFSLYECGDIFGSWMRSWIRPALLFCRDILELHNQLEVIQEGIVSPLVFVLRIFVVGIALVVVIFTTFDVLLGGHFVPTKNAFWEPSRFASAAYALTYATYTFGVLMLGDLLLDSIS